MNKTAILVFGAFNPVTNAHIMLGEKLKKMYPPTTKILYVPSNISYLEDWKQYKEDDIMDTYVRVHLLEEAVSRDNVCNIEVLGLVSGKTYDTVQYVKDKYHFDNVIICMGSDKLKELNTWYKAKELIEENKFIIVERDGVKLEDYNMSKYKDHFISLKNNDCKNISSTAVREAFKESKLDDIKDYVPCFVYGYLKELKEFKNK